MIDPQPVIRAEPSVLEAMHALPIGESVPVNNHEVIERSTTDRWLLSFEQAGKRVPVAYLDGNGNRINSFEFLSELKPRRA